MSDEEIRDELDPEEDAASDVGEDLDLKSDSDEVEYDTDGESESY